MAKSKSEKFQMRFVEISSTLEPDAYALLLDCISAIKGYEECIDFLCEFSGKQYEEIRILKEKLRSLENKEEP